MKRISIIFVKSVALLILFNSQIHAQEAPLKVVASFSILGDLIKQVGGDNVVVSLIVGTNRDAHNFSPSPQDAAKLKSADLIVINGLGSGPIDHNQKITIAAMHIADMKVCAHRS